MIEGEWSRRRLQDEMRLRLGTRKKHAGRKPRSVENLREAALQANRAAAQAIRIFDQLVPPDLAPRSAPVRLPRKLSNQIMQAKTALVHLGEVAEQIIAKERESSSTDDPL